MEVLQSIWFALRARIDALLSKSFVRSVGVLVGGTAFAQALMILLLPILTRLYTPEDFGVLAVYVSLLGIISVAACLRFEIAIPIPDNDADAANLLALALCSSATVTAAVVLIVWLFRVQVAGLVNQPVLSSYLWLLPLGVWLTSSYAALQYWATRKKQFRTIAKTLMSQAIGGSGAQVALGLAGITPFGLLFGHMIKSGAGVISLWRAAIRNDRAVLASISWSGMRLTFREYHRFPKYSSIEALANSAGTMLPMIIIAALADSAEAGFLMIATRVMQAPTGLIGNAAAQVYISHAPKEYRVGTLAEFTASVFGGLLRSGVGPIIFVGIVAPVVFVYVFGDDWRRSGELVRWMTPWLVLQFVTSPVSMTLHITNRQRTALFLQVLGLFIRIGAVMLAYFVAKNMISEFYALSGFIFYLIYFIVVIRALSLKLTILINRVVESMPIIFTWVLLGFLTNIFLNNL